METNSKEFDTIRLLQECDAGSKMAVSAIDEVLDRTQDSALKNLLFCLLYTSDAADEL